MQVIIGPERCTKESFDCIPVMYFLLPSPTNKQSFLFYENYVQNPFPITTMNTSLSNAESIATFMAFRLPKELTSRNPSRELQITT